MSLDGTKSPAQSGTVWSGVAVVVSGIITPVARHYGFDVTSQDISDVIADISNIVTVGGGIAAIYFRIRATKKIGPAPVATTTAVPHHN